jgi:hypothetical protein
MFRLGTTCTFFHKAEEVAELDLGELQMIYMSHRLIVGWLKCYANAKELKLERILN